LLIRSDINGISSSIPDKNTGGVRSLYNIRDKEIRFSFPDDYDHTKPFIVDPFVTATGNLSGLNAGKAKDVDFDYAGNIYVTGGGDGSSYKLAKFNAAGVLQWTFNGSTAIPTWTFGLIMVAGW